MDLSAVSAIEKLDVTGRRVLLRLDFDVPLSDGEVVDDTRIRAALPTIEYLLERDARIIALGHLGNPSGRVNPELSMEPVAVRLAELLPSGEVILTDSPVGDGAKRVALDLRDGHMALLENLRFHAGEAQDDDKFARGLAAMGEVYINDACSALQYAHASIVRVPKMFNKKAAGLLLKKEIKTINTLLKKAEHPFVAVIGGAKLSDKVGLIENLLNRLDVLMVGGGVANTFLAAQGHIVGCTGIERDKLPLARDLLRQIKDAGIRLLLPIDVVGTEDPDSEEVTTVVVGRISEGARVADIGPGTIAMFKDAVSRSNTVFWNGPMGIFERERFREGSFGLARTIAGSAAFSVVAGDDTAIAVRQSGMEKGFNHVSTGGAASLGMLEGRVLPGLQALVAK
jgi:phosphoglycerate kinase